MAFTRKSWDHDSYTAATWTDLAAGTATGSIVSSVVICNTTATNITLDMRVTDSGGTKLATIVDDEIIAAKSSYVLDLSSLVLGSSNKLQLYASATGLEFYASGAE